MASTSYMKIKNEPNSSTRTSIMTGAYSRLTSGCVGNRKQPRPQPIDTRSVEDEELSCNSESDDEMITTSLVFKSRQSLGTKGRCDWCGHHSADQELNLITHDRQTKQFCSENCQDMFKENILRTKVCEWCKKKYPPSSALIVMEPSIQSVPLQFCNEACVNSYKMEIFCIEVKEQLQRIKDENIQLNNYVTNKIGRRERKILITPELWNEGEQAIVFVNDTNKEDSMDSNNNKGVGRMFHSVERTALDRKRKGHSVETVINKISRHSACNSSEQLGSHIVDCTNKGRQVRPMNLSVNQSDFTEGTRTSQIGNCNMNNTDTKKADKFLPSGSFIPIPVLIPVPIPVPIPIGHLADAIDKHKVCKPGETGSSTPCTTKNTWLSTKNNPNNHKNNDCSISQTKVLSNAVSNHKRNQAELSADDPE